MKRRLAIIFFFLITTNVFSQDIFKLIEQNNYDSIVKLTTINNRFFTLRNNLGETPLMVACKLNNNLLVDYFAGHAGRYLKINNGSNALFFASDIKTVQLLVFYGLNINDTNNLGENCLFRLAELKKPMLLKQVLDGFAPEINKKDIFSGTPLMKATASGDLESVKLLIEKGAAINRFNNKGFSPLVFSVLSKNPPITRLLVMSGADLNASHIDEFNNPDGSALLKAAENNVSIEFFEILLAYGANPNVMNKSKMTPLMFAAEKNNYNLCRLLLRYGAVPGAVDLSGRTASAMTTDVKVSELLKTAEAEENKMIEAIKGKDSKKLIKLVADNKIVKPAALAFKAVADNNFEALKILVENGAPVDSRSWYNTSLLMASADVGSLEMMEFLIEKGAFVNADNYYGETALKFASRSKNPDKVKLLLTHGAQVNIKNETKWSALMPAARAGDAETMEILIKAGADVNYRFDNSEAGIEMDVLCMAVESGNEKAVKLLIENGAALNLSDTGWTALMTACKNKNVKIARYLINNGADVNAVAFPEGSAIKQSVTEKDIETVKLLVENGAILNFKNDNYWSVVMIAAFNNDLKMLEYLIQKGADVNARMKSNAGDLGKYYNVTALILAAEKNLIEIADFLIKNGADTNLADGFGLTALDHAKSDAMKELLKKNGAVSGKK